MPDVRASSARAARDLTRDASVSLITRYVETPSIAASLRRVATAREILERDLIEPEPWTGRLRRQVYRDEFPIVSMLESDAHERLEVKRYERAVGFVAEASQRRGDLTVDSLRAVAGILTGRRTEFRRTDGCIWRLCEAVGLGQFVETLYVLPPPAHVDGLLRELVATVNDSQAPPPIAAALAHVNLLGIHPLDDGNGRLARLVSAFVMLRAGYLSIALWSTEELCGERGAEYEAQLQRARGVRYWSPDTCDATSWVEWYLDAIATQAESAIALRSAHPFGIASKGA